MNVTSISDFRKGAKKYFDQVIDDNDELIITRSDGKTVVMIPLDDYNSYKETEYLLSNPANRKHLLDSIRQLNRGRTVTKTMAELKRYESA